MDTVARRLWQRAHSAGDVATPTTWFVDVRLPVSHRCRRLSRPRVSHSARILRGRQNLHPQKSQQVGITSCLFLYRINWYISITFCSVVYSSRCIAFSPVRTELAPRLASLPVISFMGDITDRSLENIPGIRSRPASRHSSASDHSANEFSVKCREIDLYTKVMRYWLRRTESFSLLGVIFIGR